jgi:RNA polymerase sigma-70 factor (ECF subfamily)
MEPEPGDVTRLLQAWSAGNEDALNELMSAVYGELHRVAHRHMNLEKRDDVLQTTALIHEACIRLIDQRRVQWQNRAQFFAIASRVMRRILVDAARRRRTTKRGSGAVPVSLDAAAIVSKGSGAEIIAVHEALERLEHLDERQSRIVEMRFFGGLSVDETAALMKISPTTVKREFSAAKAWLYRELEGTIAP